MKLFAISAHSVVAEIPCRDPVAVCQSKTKLARMIASLFLSLCQYPFVRRIIWKPIYQFLARKDVEQWSFMNYGYEPLDGGPRLALRAEDEHERYAAQLYHYLAINAATEGKEILEIGSGRGGGAAHIRRYLNPKSVIGLDLAQNAVDLSNRRHQTNGLTYTQGNAEALPFEDEQFDIVINVESCHAYGSVEKFLTEVRRVLRPGGVFLCTDMRLKETIHQLEKQLEMSGMSLTGCKVINDNVVRAIELDSRRKTERIERELGPVFGKAFREFAGVEGSKVHRDFASGKRIYKWYVLANE